MIAPLAWITAHPETCSLIALAAVSLASSVAKYMLTEQFENDYPKLSKVIRVVAKLLSDVLGAYLEAKKKPAPPSNPTIVFNPEEFDK